MEISLRLLLLLIGIAIIAAITIDGRRRFKLYRKMNKFGSQAGNDSSCFIDPTNSEQDFREPVIDVASVSNIDVDDDLGQDGDTSSQTAGSKSAANPGFGDLIILNVMAHKSESFDGPNLLQAVLSSGLRYGDMSIFHKYDSNGDSRKIVFSVASATEPGTFDLGNMGSFTTIGLSLFLSITNTNAEIGVYDLMLETAKRLADRLDGQIMTANQQPLTEEIIQTHRQQISMLAAKAQHVAAGDLSA